MDLKILIFLQSVRESLGTWADIFFELLSSHYLFALYGLAGAYAMLKGEKKKGYRIILSFIFAECLVWLVKCTFCIPRPWLRTDLLHPSETAVAGATGHSFPSGHSAAAGALLLGIRKSYGEDRKWLRVLCCVMTGLTMLSRLMLSVHTPQDVLAGLLIAVVVSRLVEVILDGAEKDTLNTEIVTGGLLAAAFAMTLYFRLKSYPGGIDEVSLKSAFRVCGMAAGCACGWYAEEKHHDGLGIRFSVITGIILFSATAAVMVVPAAYMYRKCMLYASLVFLFFALMPFLSSMYGKKSGVYKQ